MKKPKVADDNNGISMKGANFGIYGGEYGYLYNPKKMRFFLGDNVSDTSYAELAQHRHSPILGWAFDGNPIYLTHAYVDNEHKNPYNELKQMMEAIALEQQRDALVGNDLGTISTRWEHILKIMNMLGD